MHYTTLGRQHRGEGRTAGPSQHTYFAEPSAQTSAERSRWLATLRKKSKTSLFTVETKRVTEERERVQNQKARIGDSCTSQVSKLGSLFMLPLFWRGARHHTHGLNGHSMLASLLSQKLHGIQDFTLALSQIVLAMPLVGLHEQAISQAQEANLKCRDYAAPCEARRKKMSSNFAARSAAENFFKVCAFRLPFVKEISFQRFPTIQ